MNPSILLGTEDLVGATSAVYSDVAQLRATPQIFSSEEYKKQLHVCAGILYQPNFDILLTQRPENKPFAHYWEFPGGKINEGETAENAFCRELQEEIGITPTRYHLWQCLEHTYPHAIVYLSCFLCSDWQGEPQSLEQQQMAWVSLDRDLSLAPLLPTTEILFGQLRDYFI